MIKRKCIKRISEDTRGYQRNKEAPQKEKWLRYCEQKRALGMSLFTDYAVFLVILVVQPLGRLVNSLDRIDGGLQMMGSSFCGPLSALDRVTLSVLFLQHFQPSTGCHQAYTDHS